MVGPTQAEINDAVMIAKNATYKLAYELSLEQRYGGNIDCCVTKLKLLWMYENALSCQVEANLASSTIEVVSITTGDIVNIRVGTTSIINPYTELSGSEGEAMLGLTSAINTYQGRYVATYDSTVGASGRITLDSPVSTTESVVVSLTAVGLITPVVTATDLEVVNNNCLTNDKAKKLIAKIKSICNIN